MEEPQQSLPPEGNPAAYLGIVGISALLCFAWLLTGSIVLSLLIIALGLLHLARHFPEAEQFVAADPLLLWLRRMAPVIILGIVTLVVAARNMRG